MRDSIKTYFKIGTVLWMSYPDLDVLDALQTIARDDFFDAVEVCHMKDDEVRRKAKDILVQSRLKVGYGAQPTLMGASLNPNDLSEEARARAEQALVEAVDEAEYLGARGIVFMAGKWQAESRDPAYQQLLKTTRQVCAYARTKQMTVELEVFDYDMDKAVLIGPAPLAAQFARDVRATHDNFGLLADLSHFPTTYESSEFAIRTMSAYITHLHIGNAVVQKGCEAYGDMHPRFGFPNSANDVDQLLDFLRVVKSEGFLRPNDPLILSLEVKPRPGENADWIVANTKRVINRAWAMLED
jgi:sugar phosphate isomerase/epimerase